MSWTIPGINLSSRLQLVSDRWIIQSASLDDDTGQHRLGLSPYNSQTLAAAVVMNRLATVA